MPLDAIEIETAPDPKVSVIWLHGLGASANDFVPMVPDLGLDLAHIGISIRFIFPNAPMMPISVNQGFTMRAWYDIHEIDLLAREDEAGVRKSVLEVEELIAKEKSRGVPARRIFLAGFSQGSALSLTVGLRHSERLAGLVCLSGYLPLAASIEAERSPANADLPIFMAHGTIDPVVPVMYAKTSRDVLTGLGYPVQWREYLMPHTVCPKEILELGDWFHRVLASTKADVEAERA
jgi:phospholipase/carboxylesterase